MGSHAEEATKAKTALAPSSTKSWHAGQEERAGCAWTGVT